MVFDTDLRENDLLSCNAVCSLHCLLRRLVVDSSLLYFERSLP